MRYERTAASNKIHSSTLPVGARAAAIVMLALGALAPMLAAAPARAQQFGLESAIIDSATGRTLGGTRETGDLSAFFTVQKKIVSELLRRLNIALEDLPQEVRDSLERVHTTNFEAFKLFSEALDAQDEGRFAEAKALFEKALELDPQFALAGELASAMPSINAVGPAQLQSAIAVVAQTAVASGKDLAPVDLAGAIAALQAGRQVYELPGGFSDQPSSKLELDKEYTINPPGSGSGFGEWQVVGMSYTLEGNPPTSIATTNEYPAQQVVTTAGGALVSAGEPSGLLASQGNADNFDVGAKSLADGSMVHWGKWNSSQLGTFTLTSAGMPIANVGPEFHYMVGQATRSMPLAGVVTFVPGGGFLGDVNGTIGVDFGQRIISINNLGFAANDFSFSGLQGTATYAPTSASGFFSGNYSAGSCVGCEAFSPNASSFTGNFLGQDASGLMFSTILQTGDGTASGLHLFTRP